MHSRDTGIRAEIYEYLPDEAAKIREQVFMREQGFRNEFDSIDKQASHIVLWADNSPVATCRFFRADDEKCFVIGRVAVSGEYRGNGYGNETVKAAEAEIVKRGGEAVQLSAQVRVARFYRKSGYREQGDVYSDEGCPHITMRKDLNR